VLIEHVFVTTLDAGDAFRAASEFLARGAFVLSDGQPASPDGAVRVLDAARGKRNAARALSVPDLPQRLRLEWDRGRITVAAAIEYFARSLLLLSRSEPPADSPRIKPHVELLNAIVLGLDEVLTRGTTVDEAAAPWMALERRLRIEGAAARRTHRLILLVLLATFVVVIVFAIAVSV
jgi:hypothetical protein